jgi:LacI family transcriptional regulator
VQGVEDALDPGRVLVFLCESRDDRLREQHYLQALLGRRVGGIIVTERRQDRREPIGRDLRVPVVYAMAYSSDLADSPSSPTTTKTAAPWPSATCSARGGRASGT